jgi:hypothetical protein
MNAARTQEGDAEVDSGGDYDEDDVEQREYIAADVAGEQRRRRRRRRACRGILPTHD